MRFVQLLLAAGTETTTNLITNAVLCLLEHPAELARVRADAALIPPMLEEVLRHRTPVQAMFRATTQDVELSGQTIPAGKFVMAMIGAANRDPRQFPDPHRFDVTREPNAHVAFGHGIHFCLGAPAAAVPAVRVTRYHRGMRTVLIVLSLLVASTALADVAPPNQCDKPGEKCNTAGNDYKSPGICQTQKCSRQLPGPNGVERHEYDCNLCVPEPAKPQGGATRKAGACNVGGDPGTAAALLLVGLFLVATRRR